MVGGNINIPIETVALPEPMIVNDAATNLTTTSVTLHGDLTSTGAAASTVSVYWGEDPLAWDDSAVR